MGKKQTPYGPDRYRRPVVKGEFRYPGGTLPEAVILDLDDTFVSWGTTNKTVMDWLDKHYRLDRVIIVITARTHGWEYESSFNMLLRDLPYPFIGPFCRVGDDPRYASEFKRETAEYLSGIFTIVGAADDNREVNLMWKWWAKEYGPADFDLLEVEPPRYDTWRKDLPRKGYVTPIQGKHRVVGTRDFSEPQGWEQQQDSGWWDHYATTGSTSGKDKDLDIIEVEFFIEEVGS